MSYGSGSFRYSPLTKYAGTPSHSLYGSSHSLNNYPTAYGSSTSGAYGTSPYTSEYGSGYGSGYSSRSGSTSSISSIGSTGYGASSAPYRVSGYYIVP